MSKSDGFRIVEHLSDVAVRSYSQSIEGLFEMSAMGMSAIISDTDKIAGSIKKRIMIKKDELTRPSLEDLLILWLEKILYIHESQNMLFSSFKVKRIDIDDEICLESYVSGEKIDLKKHDILAHIKAPTYHDLEIMKDKKNDRYTVDVIFDI